MVPPSNSSRSQQTRKINSVIAPARLARKPPRLSCEAVFILNNLSDNTALTTQENPNTSFERLEKLNSTKVTQERSLSDKSFLVATRKVRRPPLAVCFAKQTSLCASSPHECDAGHILSGHKSKIRFRGFLLVPRRGLEPPCRCQRYHLKVVRLPVSPPGHICCITRTF